MHKILQKLEALSCQKLHWWIVVISILIAAQVQYIQHGWINPDSVLYLESAKAFSNGNWKAGFDIFEWPLYSLCITLINKITQFGVHVSAQILNVIFFAIATYSFIKIIQLAGGKQRQLIAGALIWLSAQYMISGVLEMLMRDEGFWAFFLFSLVFFIQFYQKHQLKHALLWQVCIIIATLFRIEAILYLMFLPCLLLFQTQYSWQQRMAHLLKAHAINITLGIIIIIGVFLTNDTLSTKLLGRLNEVFTTDLWQQFTKIFIEKSSILSSQVLGEYLEEFAAPSLLLTFVYVMCVKTIGATGIINVGLAGLLIKNNKRLIEKYSYQVLCVAAAIALLNMALIITKVFVLSGRYVMGFSFVLMIFAAFYLAEILFKLIQKKQKYQSWFVIGLVAIMLGGAIKNLLPKKAGYNYQQEAVAWVKSNNTKNKSVFYDEPRMRYYANESFIKPWPDNWLNIESFLGNKQIYQYDYLLINFNNEQANKKLQFEKQLPEYNNTINFYNAKANKHTAVYVKNKTQ
jgi:hypothetical protein